MKKSDVAGKMNSKHDLSTMKGWKSMEKERESLINRGPRLKTSREKSAFNKMNESISNKKGSASLNSTGKNEGETMMLPKTHNNRS